MSKTNPIIPNMPRFGPKLDLSQHKSYMQDFEAEMYRFEDRKRERDRYVNVLHLSTDLDTLRPKMDRITKCMKKWGYDVNHKRGLSMSNDKMMYSTCIDTDLFVVGSKKAMCSSVRYMLQCVGVGWFGITPYWDMLWYGIDYEPKPLMEWIKQNDGEPTLLPVFSDNKFALDCVCLIYAHIRRRYDRARSSGLANDIIREIEGRIDWLLDKSSKNHKTHQKVKKFEDKVRNDGHYGPDAELFFAALNILRHDRNVGAHLVKGPLQEEKRKKEFEKYEKKREYFDTLSNKYERLYHSPNIVSITDSHVNSKWMISMAHMAVAWLEQYKLYSK